MSNMRPADHPLQADLVGSIYITALADIFLYELFVDDVPVPAPLILRRDDDLPASTFRSPEFAEDYGERMMNGPMEGLCARAVVVVDEDGRVVYSELVSPLNADPDYDAALGAL